MVEITLSSDEDGFLSRECPSCERRFKVMLDEDSDLPHSCCPYCGHQGEDCWLTTEQAEYIQGIAMDRLVVPELERLTRDLGRSSGGLLKVSAQHDFPKPPKEPIDTDGDFKVFQFPCCHHTVKLETEDRYYCLSCGSEFDMTTTNAKKIFLSHKGCDKAMVIEFKQTLDTLGYEPWLDTDAMPAGTHLERGLLNGMENSCAVIFFITPNFEDDGYLATEIDYAIGQKRAKKDKFSIITLQMADENGRTGTVPELLKPYVWRTPTSSLEALRDIVKALPISVAAIDWREGIEGVVKTASVPTVSDELSNEARQILLAAVDNGGLVQHTDSFTHTHISTGPVSLLPDQEDRTIAVWLGGLEDLQRRRLIKDQGSQGHLFKVTREGYLAADALKAEMQTTSN